MVECLELTEDAGVLVGDEVDRNTLLTETTGTTNAVDVVLKGGGEIVVDDEGDLLNVDTTSEEVGGDEDTGGAVAELL